MKYKKIVFTGHSIQRIFERGIEPEIIEDSIKNGEIIETYRDDKPYPSFLILHYIECNAVHVVFSFDEENETVFIITAYYPDISIWEENFKVRRTK